MDKNTSISILYVEDQDDVRLFLSKILSRHFTNIILAANGKEGLEKYSEHKPDIVISDIKMPVMDGLSMSSRIKAINPRAQIILTTAHSDMEYFIQSIEIGISQYILKPIDREKLFKAIDTCKDHVMLEREVENQQQKLRKTNEMLTRHERELRESLQKAIALKEMIAKSEENFRVVAENIQDAFWLRDSKKIIFVNKAFEFLFELPTNHLFLNPEIFKEFIHPDDRGIFISRLHEYELKQSGTFGAEFRIITPSGKVKNIWYREAFIRSENNKEKRRLSTLSDISWKIENEKLHQELLVAEKSAQIKQRLLSNVSHEMRTPLNGIIAMSQILADTSLSPVQEDYLDNIRRSGEDLMDLTTNLLDINELEYSGGAINEQLITTVEFFPPILDNYSEAARQKGLDFKISYKEGFPTRFYTDPHRIKQILKHFIDNAIKFTYQGTVLVVFDSKEISGNQFNISITVEDTGVGIKEEYLDKIFHLFTQQEENEDRRFEGLGLGLTICQRIANLLKGKIEVKSKIGSGSSFTFTFPSLAEVNEKKPALLSVPRLNLRVLYVEDKEVNQKIISIMLTNAYCQVDIASNGAEALDMYEENKYDIILMDIQMPVMDGITATQELRKKYDFLPPIIGVSANALRADAQHYISKGLDDYISKPVVPATLYEKIQQWCMSENNNSASTSLNDLVSASSVSTEYILLPDIDFETIDSLREQTQYDDEVINELYTIFLQEAGALMDKIHESIYHKDFRTLKDSTHALKGLSATVGAMKVYHISSEMDNLHKQNIYMESESLYDLLVMDYNKVKTIINEKIIRL